MTPHIIPFYCHVTNRSGFAIVDELGMLTGDFYATYPEAVEALIIYVTN